MEETAEGKARGGSFSLREFRMYGKAWMEIKGYLLVWDK